MLFCAAKTQLPALCIHPLFQGRLRRLFEESLNYSRLKLVAQHLAHGSQYGRVSNTPGFNLPFDHFFPLPAVFYSITVHHFVLLKFLIIIVSAVREIPELSNYRGLAGKAGGLPMVIRISNKSSCFRQPFKSLDFLDNFTDNDAIKLVPRLSDQWPSMISNYGWALTTFFTQ